MSAAAALAAAPAVVIVAGAVGFIERLSRPAASTDTAGLGSKSPLRGLDVERRRSAVTRAAAGPAAAGDPPPRGTLVISTLSTIVEGEEEDSSSLLREPGRFRSVSENISQISSNTHTLLNSDDIDTDLLHILAMYRVCAIYKIFQ